MPRKPVSSMVWGLEDSTVVGLAGIAAGVIATGLSLWWNYKTRALPHREFLYEKQIEAYLELATVITSTLAPCYDYLNNLMGELTPKRRIEFNELLLKAHTDHAP